MLKLPPVFRGHDREMHAIFYFFAAAFLNILFGKNKFSRHVFFFVTLLIFGICIEYAQEYSNKFFNKRIHGRFDIEDVEYNVKGLIAFSALWFTYIVLILGSKKSEKIIPKQTKDLVSEPINNWTDGPVDFIGDIHGHADELEQLLHKMGYEKLNNSFVHPTRKVIFVGDYIDRGPKIRKTLQIVKSMVDAGNAMALMGNHEYNAFCFHTPKKEGGYLREHSIKNILQHAETLRQFHNYQDEYNAYISWFKKLPIFYEHSNYRIVHACWDNSNIEFLKSKLDNGRLNEDQLIESSIPGTRMHDVIEQTLKGKEMTLPSGMNFTDKDGNIRSEIRIKWWENPEEITLKNYSILSLPDLPDTRLEGNQIKSASYYSPENKVVFFGHYWLRGEPQLFKSNVCCLDYSVAKGGSLVAYRYDGERELSGENFLVV